MLIYVTAPRTRSTEEAYVKDKEYINELELKGHTIIQAAAHRKDIIPRCDAVVYLVGWNVDDDCLADLSYAKMMGVPTYSWAELPELHPTELNCPEQTVEFMNIIMRMYRMHLDKNADYSPANILGTGMNGLATRLWDKLVRFMSLYGYPISIKHYRYGMKIIFLNKRKKLKEPKNEPIEDTLLDMAAYSIIALLLQKGKWGK